MELEKVKSLKNLLDKLYLIPECSIILKNGKIVEVGEKVEEGDEIEVITFGWEKL